MSDLPTVLLRHDLPDGSHHFDWLLATPADPDGLLWGGRVGLPSDQWIKAGQWDLEVLPPHRRRYLQYEGLLSDNRGSVRRVDEGSISVIEWTDHLIVVDLAMKHCRGRVEVSRVDATHYRARLLVPLPGPQSPDI
jgi:hypothetical protein